MLKILSTLALALCFSLSAQAQVQTQDDMTELELELGILCDEFQGLQINDPVLSDVCGECLGNNNFECFKLELPDVVAPVPDIFKPGPLPYERRRIPLPGTNK